MQTFTVDLTKIRLGRSSLRSLKIRAASETLTQLDVERFLSRIEAAFDEFTPALDDAADPIRAPFRVATGGARG